MNSQPHETMQPSPSEKDVSREEFIGLQGVVTDITSVMKDLILLVKNLKTETQPCRCVSVSDSWSETSIPGISWGSSEENIKAESKVKIVKWTMPKDSDVYWV